LLVIQIPKRPTQRSIGKLPAPNHAGRTANHSRCRCSGIWVAAKGIGDSACGDLAEYARGEAAAEAVAPRLGERATHYAVGQYPFDGDALAQGSHGVDTAEGVAAADAFIDTRLYAIEAGMDGGLQHQSFRNSQGCGYRRCHLQRDLSHHLIDDETDEDVRKIPAGVGQADGVVQHIAVAVVALAVVGELDEGVGGEKTPQIRVIDPSVHVDQADAVQVFVSGEAPGFDAVRGRGAAPVGRAAFAPGFEAGAFSDLAVLVEDEVYRAQVIPEQVAGLCIFAGDLDGDGVAVGADVVAVAGAAVAAGDALQITHIVDGFGDDTGVAGGIEAGSGPQAPAQAYGEACLQVDLWGLQAGRYYDWEFFECLIE